ncbi:unnamed protein product [Urochloa humidicola]
MRRERLRQSRRQPSTRPSVLFDATEAIDIDLRDIQPISLWVQVYNLDELMLSALPYHDTHAFVRIVQLLNLGSAFGTRLF